jgi:acyl transferase domain-containing protein
MLTRSASVKSHAKQAGFLQTRVDAFDPLFFGISPREAAVLDPAAKPSAGTDLGGI